MAIKKFSFEVDYATGISNATLSGRSNDPTAKTPMEAPETAAWLVTHILILLRNTGRDDLVQKVIQEMQ